MGAVGWPVLTQPTVAVNRAGRRQVPPTSIFNIVQHINEELEK